MLVDPGKWESGGGKALPYAEKSRTPSLVGKGGLEGLNSGSVNCGIYDFAIMVHYGLQIRFIGLGNFGRGEA